MNKSFFSISARGVLGKLIRIPLRMIPQGTVVPILATRGKKRIVGSGLHSWWLGFNEIQKRRAFSSARYTVTTIGSAQDELLALPQ